MLLLITESISVAGSAEGSLGVHLSCISGVYFFVEGGNSLNAFSRLR